MKNTIVLFKNDLRLIDNPALWEACQTSKILPVYIFDDAFDTQKMGSASKYWLYHSLTDLNKNLQQNVLFFKGRYQDILENLVQKYDISDIYWNRSYTPYEIERDKTLKTFFLAKKINVKSFNAGLLFEPWTIVQNKTQNPYKVFTAFHRRCLDGSPPRDLYAKPNNIQFLKHLETTTIDHLDLLSQNKWYEKLDGQWEIGEKKAFEKLTLFLATKIDRYKEGRNYPTLKNTSYLSPHLHFGEISPHQIWWEVKKKFAENAQADFFLRELIWREFSYHLLYYFPQIPNQNILKKFDHFPWQMNDAFLKNWQQGETGYPIIDAGMRELWQTGYMHNRVRMLVASFLIKNLNIGWQEGAAWFWDCLLDADLANNSASWQWVAGSGFDAAPYFRIFNPTTQAIKFDPQAEYIKKYIPQLRKLPLKYIFEPWKAPPLVLKEANITIGATYPAPIIDLKESRENTLYLFKNL
jgi:deoxyribodipyrimidine photo-lyase